MTIDEARGAIGLKVAYRPPHPGAAIEEGIITSVNARYVFVRYGAQVHSSATRPEDLTFVSPRPRPTFGPIHG